MMKFSTGLKFAAVAATLLLAGCETKPPANTAPPPETMNNSSSTTSSIIPGSAEDLRVNVGDTVHFDYDKYNITDEDRGVLQRQAQWLAKYPQIRVTVEGHCDERGTREYNLALGNRRATAVKNALVALGIPAARIQTISYGKERPAVVGSNEAAWAQNRRGVTVIN
jgi:peptidoglycan-associated lipoprotein